MKPLPIPTANAFVSGFTQEPAVANLGVQDFLNTQTSNIFKTGTQQFNELRYCLLRESEQHLLMAINCYARALETLRAGSSYWSVVSLYYAAFFAAKSILGNHGCWISGAKSWIEVTNSSPTNLQLQFRQSQYTCPYSGSHQVTWCAYYNALKSLSPFLTTQHALLAKTPVNGKETWLIDVRKDLNYSPLEALQACRDFNTNFNANNVPSFIGGKSQTMLKTSQAIVFFAKETAIRTGLSTDIWGPSASRSDYSAKNILAQQHAALSSYYNAQLPSLLF
ncbi:hypothetical protein [Hydrogenophaga sp. RWCD_12]|uniref:hypothetical protein n=1 Tax=Hydrogenophaga sp. RWCD_12 TaxID=3391190 RepID=UPI003984637F